MLVWNIVDSASLASKVLNGYKQCIKWQYTKQGLIIKSRSLKSGLNNTYSKNMKM